MDAIGSLFACVFTLTHRLGLDERGYWLIANGGCYQGIPQLYFHLACEDPAHSP